MLTLTYELRLWIVVTTRIHIISMKGVEDPVITRRDNEKVHFGPVWYCVKKICRFDYPLELHERKLQSNRKKNLVTLYTIFQVLISKNIFVYTCHNFAKAYTSRNSVFCKNFDEEWIVLKSLFVIRLISCSKCNHNVKVIFCCWLCDEASAFACKRNEVTNVLRKKKRQSGRE